MKEKSGQKSRCAVYTVSPPPSTFVPASSFAGGQPRGRVEVIGGGGGLNMRQISHIALYQPVIKLASSLWQNGRSLRRYTTIPSYFWLTRHIDPDGGKTHISSAPDLGTLLSEPRDDDSEFRLF